MTAPPIPVIRGHYVKGPKSARKLSSHIKYAQHRKLGEHETREDRHIFNQESDKIGRKDAIQDVMAHTSRSVSYHSIILSPGEHEHVEDFRQWTRNIMSDLQERKGVQLHWYAVVHAHERENTNEPHVHLVLAGAGEDFQTGKMKTVRMDRQEQDYAFLRERGREHSNYTFYHELEKAMHDLDTLDTVGHEQPERVHEQVYASVHMLDDYISEAREL